MLRSDSIHLTFMVLVEGEPVLSDTVPHRFVVRRMVSMYEVPYVHIYVAWSKTPMYVVYIHIPMLSSLVDWETK